MKALHVHTFDSDRDSVLVSFFEREFGQAARLLAKQDIELLAPGPDGECVTYYVERQGRALEPADFELNLEDLQEVKRTLRGLWKGPESFILADVSDKILALAPRYASVEEVEDVSPFIYVMF